ncbi:MAG: hypothetical protein LBF27_30935 [Sphingobacterium sp.]|jgi:hypothetical protein|nr:hypothetical protein [Sphingobacterium sp.]
MLQQFTWLQFSIAVAIITVLWYITILLLFFKEEIKNLMGFGSVKKTAPPPTERTPEPPALMGASKLPEGVTETYELEFGPRTDDKVHRLGAISDFLEETKDIFEIVQNEGGGKEELLEMLKELLKHYPNVKESRHRRALVDHLKEHSPLNLSSTEIEELFL